MSYSNPWLALNGREHWGGSGHRCLRTRRRENTSAAMASSHALVVPCASQSAIVSGQIACGVHLCKLTKRYLDPSLCLGSGLIRSTTSLRSAKSSFLPSTQTLKGQQQREAPGVVSWRRIKKKESGFVSAAALFSFLEKRKDKEVVKRELLAAIQPLDRGAQATADDLANIDKV